jgi:hypothetical protein
MPDWAAGKAGRQARTVQIVQQRVQFAHVALRSRRVLIVAGQYLGVIGIRPLMERRSAERKKKICRIRSRLTKRKHTFRLKNCRWIFHQKKIFSDGRRKRHRHLNTWRTVACPCKATLTQEFFDRNSNLFRPKKYIVSKEDNNQPKCDTVPRDYVSLKPCLHSPGIL